MTGEAPQPNPTTAGRKDGDFPAPVIRTLEQQAGSRCCNPGCGQATRAKSWDGTKAISIGTAAHIHAAAAGGARYDAGMTPEQRKSADNGIWMCRNCGTLVDTDEGGFPPELLREWKKAALDSRRDDVVAPAKRLHPSLSSNGLATPDAADVVRYSELIAELPSNGVAMTWVRDWDCGSSYRRRILEPLEIFLSRWTAAERAFNTPRVQASLVTLTKALSLFLTRVYSETCMLDANAELASVPRDWHHKDPPRWLNAVQAIHTHADAVVAAHAELIRVAKEELRT
jgi:hypothetical protein